MHGFDSSIPRFLTFVQGICIVVTQELISDVLYVSKVSHPDYPGCPRLWIVSKDKLMSLFYETPSSSGDRQNTPYSAFAKGSRFLNMVMTFVLHPLSHYNSITEPRAHFLLSLFEGLTIDFPFHFILSLIDVYKDTMTRDKFVFASAITRIIRHASVSYPESAHFSIIGAISSTSVRRSEAQLPHKWPRIEIVTPPASFAPFTSVHSSSLGGGVTLEAVMAQLQRMDARLNTFSDELCQVNTRVGRIARRQTRLGGFVASPSPSPDASKDEDDDGDSDGDDDKDEDEDENASSSSDEKMTA